MLNTKSLHIFLFIKVDSEASYPIYVSIFKEGPHFKQTPKTHRTTLLRDHQNLKEVCIFSLQFVYTFILQYLLFTLCFRQCSECLQMHLNKKFQEAASSQAIKINTMEVDTKYPIVNADRVTTKFGKTVLMSIKESPCKIVKVYLPKRYSSITSNENIGSINLMKVSLNLIYKGMCETSKSYILAIQ